MESPPSFSTNSEVPPLSEDSGLLITSGSFSSDSASGWHQIGSELQESDYDEKSLSLCESTDVGHMCGDNFNTVKKGPAKITVTTIEPPPQFQDSPVQTSPIPITITKSSSVEVSRNTDDTYEIILNAKSATLNVPMSGRHVSPIYGHKVKCEVYERRGACLQHRFASPRLLPLSPGRARPASRASLSSRRSTSHSSLVHHDPHLQDDSSFITQAISHDALSAAADITDMYNVPFDSDIYAVPIDMVRPSLNNLRAKGKKQRVFKKRKSNSYTLTVNTPAERNKTKEPNNFRYREVKNKRHSLQSMTTRKSESDTDSLHMTLREMRKYLHTLYSSSSDSETRNTINKRNNTITNKAEIHSSKQIQTTKDSGKLLLKESTEISNKIVETNNNKKVSKNTFGLNTKSRKHKENICKDLVESEKLEKNLKKSIGGQNQKSKISPVRILSINLKQSFCNLFRWRRQTVSDSSEGGVGGGGESSVPSVVRRALPPLPQSPDASPPAAAPSPVTTRPHDEETVASVFATSIQKVKDYGWYWGPISVETAEKILSNEPDGSFIVRDSSDDHYIFTLTFKLNGLRHVRIEHDQGFCFAGCAMFKAQTIVEFIENAVETSRSGRYLFFLNLRPVLGPVRVQLLFPVSRFKRVQSLQHMCRFVILKYVRRDLIGSLPLPRRIVDYLSATHYYAEMLAEI